MGNPLYSLVIPMKDEAESVYALIQEIEEVMTSMGQPWELICINDGSKDETEEHLCTLLRSKAFLRLLSFTRCFGQSACLEAGFARARGEFVITLDGDGQNDPADIPKLVAAVGGWDLVCGERIARQDPWLKKKVSRLANAIRRWICQDGIRDTGCSLKIYRASALRQIKMYEGMHRFLPALFHIAGFRVRQIPVGHRERRAGKSKYPFYKRLIRPLLDLFAVAWMRRRALRYTIAREIP